MVLSKLGPTIASYRAISEGRYLLSRYAKATVIAIGHLNTSTMNRKIIIAVRYTCGVRNRGKEVT